MDLEATADQTFFQETTRRFLEAESPLTRVRGLAAEPAGFERAWWRRGAELGWTSLLVSEADGGGSLSGGALSDLIIVAEEMGRLVSPGPLLPCNVVASAVSSLGTEAQKSAVLPGLVSGDIVAAWCFAEPDGQWNDIAMSATAKGDDFVLSGTKTRVEAGAEADTFLVTARTDGGLTQFLVPAGTAGVSVTAQTGADLVRRFAKVTFDGAVVPGSSVLGAAGAADADVERQLEIAVVLQCAEMAGAATRVLEFTLEYAGDRNSFGRPLASYQALKHRFADMKLWMECSHATTLGAARAVDVADDDAAKLVSVAKAYVGDHVPELMQDCVQMHGGIGVTWEHDIHLYQRRATVDAVLFGTPTDHRERIAGFVGL